MPILGFLFSFLVLQATHQKVVEPPPVPKRPPYDATWTKEVWLADEAIYLKIRKEVEAYVLRRKVS